MNTEDPLRGFTPPAPPDGLREAALRAARAALASPAPDVWTRLYLSPVARAAWAASVLLLLAAQLLVPSRRPESVARAARRSDSEIAAVTRLPRIDRDALSRVGAKL